MIIRRNSKEYFGIEQIINEELTSNSKSSLKLFSIPPGRSLADRVELKNQKSSLNKLYYTMAKENLISSLKNKDVSLYRADDNPNLYYFAKTKSKDYIESAFELNKKITLKIQ